MDMEAVMGQVNKFPFHNYPFQFVADQNCLCKAIGIDLGASYSRVGIFRGDNFEPIPDAQGRTRTPSYVSFLNNEVLVGEEARAMSIQNPKNTLHNVRYDDSLFAVAIRC